MKTIAELQELVKVHGMPTRDELRAYLGDAKPISDHDLDLILFGLGEPPLDRLDPEAFRPMSGIIAGSGVMPNLPFCPGSGNISDLFASWGIPLPPAYSRNTQCSG